MWVGAGHFPDHLERGGVRTWSVAVVGSISSRASARRAVAVPASERPRTTPSLTSSTSAVLFGRLGAMTWLHRPGNNTCLRGLNARRADRAGTELGDPDGARLTRRLLPTSDGLAASRHGPAGAGSGR